MTDDPTILDTPNDPPEDDPKVDPETLPDDVRDGDVGALEPEGD